MTLLGNLALWLALLLGVWGAAAGVMGVAPGRVDLARSAMRAGRATAAALAVALAALAVAVFRQDFNVAYVAAHAGRAVTGWSYGAVLYAGPPGVALLYVAVLAAAAAFARGTLDARVEALRGAFVNGAVACVVAALVFVLQPFGRLPFTPVDGAGLEPGLHQGAAALGALLGLVASATLTVPFAGVVAGLAVRAVDPRWILHAHRWTAGAWLLLSAGGVLRARALYVEPGTPVPWWAQPAVVGSVAVWLAVTATLHGTAAERRRDAMPRWSLAGVAGSWVLAAWATSATSVSATGSPGPAVGVALLAAALVAGVVWWSGGRVGGDDGGAAPAPARRVAAHVAHAGAVLLAIGCASAAWHRGVRVELQPAETTTLASPLGYHYGLTYLGTSRYERGNQIVTAATLALTRSGRRIGVRRAERLLYVDVMGRPVAGPRSRVALWGGAGEDVRIELLETGDVGETATLLVALTPLAICVWVGGGLLLLGGLITVQGSFTRPSPARR